MINAISTPASGRVLLDANNTLIKIQSTNGEGYYFRAKIYINDALFDEQAWSREDQYIAVKDLKKLYQAYFSPTFSSTLIGGLTEQTNLIRKVNILIEEYSMATGEMTSNLNLPVFYILYNVVPEAFSDSTVLKLLGIDVENLLLPVSGKLAIPFYVNVNNQTVKVSLKTAQGTEIDTRSVTATGKKVFLYKYSLANYSFGDNIPYLQLTITVGGITITKYIRILYNPPFPVKELAFMNNFGYYLYAYPFGELSTESAYDISTYDTADKRQKVYEINEEETYTITSGAYKTPEKAIIGMIANSIDVKLYVPTFTALRSLPVWVDLVSKTKKYSSFTDRVHNYSEKLIFSVQKNIDVLNTGFVSVSPAHPDIEITNTVVSGVNVTLTIALNNGFSTTNLRAQYRTSGNSTWYVVGDAITGGSITFTKPAGTYSARVVDYNNLSNISNTVNFTI